MSSWGMPLKERPLPLKDFEMSRFTRNIFHSGKEPHTLYLDGFSTNAPMDHIFRCKGATCGFTSISSCFSKWTRDEEPCSLCDN